MTKFVFFLALSFSLKTFATNQGSYAEEKKQFFKSAMSKSEIQKNQPFLNLHQENILECRNRIKSLMCLVDPATSKGKRECLQGGEKYAFHFEQLFDNYPLVLQKVFCSLDVIYIEKVFVGTAYAGTSDEDKLIVLGIRKSVLDEKLNLHTWASWKEQLSFGGKPDVYEINPQLPEIQVSPVNRANDFLYFVVAHEFGHILDFANKVNQFKEACPEWNGTGLEPECEMKEDSWGALSWKTNKTPRVENDFSNRTGLCFYWCGQMPLAQTTISQVYNDLIEKSDFISLYSTTQPWDDFADSLAYYVTSNYLHQSYVIDTKQGSQYDIMKKLKSSLFAKKYQYIERFLQRTDLIYPTPKI